MKERMAFCKDNYTNCTKTGLDFNPSTLTLNWWFCSILASCNKNFNFNLGISLWGNNPEENNLQGGKSVIFKSVFNYSSIQNREILEQYSEPLQPTVHVPSPDGDWALPAVPKLFWTSTQPLT